MSIKVIILGGMSLYAVLKHDSVEDNSTSTQQNSIVHTDDCNTELSDDNTELLELRDTLEKAEAKYDQCCTSPESDCSERLDEIRKATKKYAKRAYQTSHRQSQKNLTSILHDMESRFEKNCKIVKAEVDGDREYKMARNDSILVGQNECHPMYHAIKNMKEWMHLRKWSSTSK